MIFFDRVATPPMSTSLLRAFGVCVALLVSGAAAAQQQQPLAGYDNITSDRQQRTGDNHYTFNGGVELKRGDTELYADTIERRSSRRSSPRPPSPRRRSPDRTPTFISTATPSRRSAPRNTGSPAADSPPACSRRRAGC
jgi:hypothetical protein